MTKSNVFKNVRSTLTLASVMILLSGCAGDTGGNNDRERTNDNLTRQEQEAFDQGTYRIRMDSLNEEKTGEETEGYGFIHVDNNKIEVYMNIDDSHKKVVHMQNIRTGSDCPTSAEDKNSDGWIDVTEADDAFGPILVNLDADLRTLLAGVNTYPLSDDDEEYIYKESANYNKFMDDLQSPDLDPTDTTTRLNDDEALDLEIKRVVIHGVPSTLEIPNTVATFPGLPSHVTLPIACGTIERITGEAEVAALAEMKLVKETSAEGQIIETELE